MLIGCALAAVLLFAFRFSFAKEACGVLREWTVRPEAPIIPTGSSGYRSLYGALIVVYLQANTTWRAAPSRRFNLALEVKQQLGVIPSPNRRLLPTKCHEVTLAKATVLPEAFDARTNWPACPTIGEIRDQGSCGSCWAFGAVEAMSDRICIHSGGKKVVRISAQDLVSCCGWACGMGCNGGLPEGAWKYWVKHGLVSGGLFGSNDTCRPYEIPPCDATPKCVHQCQAGYPKSYKEDIYFGAEAYNVHANEEHIKLEIMMHGSVEADFEVFADFVHYKSGVYQHVSGGFLGGHAVRLLGWGVENGTPYWLAANSWNTDWGEDGFFKIRRGKNECGIEADVNAGIPKDQTRSTREIRTNCQIKVCSESLFQSS
ncbi:unnamed protein product [Schistocephalus solidus]|uniref:Cathepsin B-like cysteine proteinase n=1 Tax=Schistocephalus solidus TaxID=70667 RepID=A0A183SQT2_SCHSO|nr:unnamed protein product [Schistocephalus solidus]